MFRSQTPLRKSLATRTAPSPNFARSIAYPLLEAKRRSRFFMTIVLLWTRAGLRHWREHQEDFCQAIGLTSGEKYETQKTHHAQDMRQPKRVAAKILEELASSLEAAFEAAAIESARVGLADDAHDLTQRIVRSTAKRKGVMRKAADLLG